VATQLSSLKPTNPVDSSQQTAIARSAQQLQTDLSQLATQASKTLRREALIWWTGLTLAILASVLLLDCWLQREEPGLRWLALLGLVAGSIYGAIRLFGPHWNLSLRPLDVARWIEAKQPQWAGKISTALQLAEASSEDTRYGSPVLRSAALAQWCDLPERPRWQELINRGGVRRASLSLLALILLLVAGGLWKPENAWRSVQRLLMPWSDIRWPTQDQLAFVNPPGMAGYEATLQLEIIDRRPPLPNVVNIEVRWADTPETAPLVIPTQRVGDLAVASLPPLIRDLQVRAVGGDDQQMSWHSIRVVNIPSWKQSGFRIQPPEYLKQSPAALRKLSNSLVGPEQTYELAGPRIQVVSGSRVQFVGELDAPATQVSMRSNTDQTLPWSYELAADGRLVTTIDPAGQALALIERPCSWKNWVQLQADVDLEMPGSWSLDIIPDNIPRVTLELALMTSHTLNAAIKLRGLASDDWGLKEVVAKLTVASQADLQLSFAIDLVESDSRQTAIDVNWDYAPELAKRGVVLQPNDQITIWLEARDLLGQIGKSQTQQYSIESRQRQLENIASRQSKVAQRLSELLNMQQTAKDVADRSLGSLDSQPITQSPIDTATSVNQYQQTIRQQLVDAPQNLKSQVNELQELLRANDLQDTQLSEQFEQLAQQIQQIGTGSAEVAWEASSKLRKELERARETDGQANSSAIVSELSQSQGTTLQQLRGLLDQLESSQSRQQQRDGLLQIAHRQAELLVESNQLNLQSLKNLPRDWLDQVRAISTKQADLAIALEKWLSSIMHPASGQANEPAMQPGLQQAAAFLMDQQVSALMRAASNYLRNEQLGQALPQQELALQALQQAVGNLRTDAASELTDELSNQQQLLQEFSAQAGQLAGRQRQLAEQMADSKAGDQSAELAQQQRQLLQDTAELAPQLGRDQKTLDSIAQAQQQQQQAIAAAESQQMSVAAQSSGQAANQLESLANELHRRAEQAGQELAQQQLFDLNATIEMLIQQQQLLMPRYKQLADQQELPQLPADHQTLTNGLLDKQTAIREQVRQTQAAIKQLQVFHWVLAQIEADLTRALAALERNRVRPEASTAAQEALSKLQLAAASMRQEPDSDQPPDQSTDQEPTQQSDQQETVSLPPVASLKLIRALQLELKEQTEAVNNSQSNQAGRLAELSKQQLELSQIFEQMIEELTAEQQVTP
jgi:hypothetical protein